MDDDVTSLVQIQNIVHLGKESTQSNPNTGCKLNDTLALALVTPLITAVAEHASWDYDTTWMLEEQCKVLQQTNDCRKKSSASTCHDGCQWEHDLKRCSLLRVDNVIAYAKADVKSPFGIYTAKMRQCNGRSEKACTTDHHCLWTPQAFWAPCVVGPTLFKEAMCSSSWQALLKRAEECRASTSEESCSKAKCRYNKDSRLLVEGYPCEMQAAEWYSMGFGKEAGAVLAKAIPKTEGCQAGPWKHACDSLIDTAHRCHSMQFKDHKCHDGCFKQAGKCVMTDTVFASLCKKGNPAEKPAEKSSGHRSFPAAAAAAVGVIFAATSMVGPVM